MRLWTFHDRPLLPGRMRQKQGNKTRVGKVQVTTVLKTRAKGDKNNEFCQPAFSPTWRHLPWKKKIVNTFISFQGDSWCYCSEYQSWTMQKKNVSGWQVKHLPGAKVQWKQAGSRVSALSGSTISSLGRCLNSFHSNKLRKLWNRLKEGIMFTVP